MKQENLVERLEKCQQEAARDNDTHTEVVPDNHQVITSKVQLTDAERELFNLMRKSLPDAIGRAEVGTLLPGVIKPQTLAHADSAGVGPENSWKLGRKVIYSTDSLLLWLVSKKGVARMGDSKKFTV